jgi:Fe-S-cluster containining protein
VQPGEALATLTRADVERIRLHTGLAQRRFVEEEGLDEESASAYEASRPLFRGYFRRAPVRLTLRQRAGRAGGPSACVFHAPGTGCTLPADVRPLACRLYPFERFADGSWGAMPGRYGSLAAARAGGSACLAVEEAPESHGSVELQALLAAFHTSLQALQALGAQLTRESDAHGRG